MRINLYTYRSENVKYWLFNNFMILNKDLIFYMNEDCVIVLIDRYSITHLVAALLLSLGSLKPPLAHFR